MSRPGALRGAPIVELIQLLEKLGIIEFRIQVKALVALHKNYLIIPDIRRR